MLAFLVTFLGASLSTLFAQFLSDLTATRRGFQESRVLLPAVELDIFTAVGPGATAAQV